MERAEAEAIFDQGKEAVIAKLLELARKAELYDRLSANQAAAPSGSRAPYDKQNIHRDPKRRKKPGRKKGHPGSRRKPPPKIDEIVEHEITVCPDCGGPLSKTVEVTERVIEDIELKKAKAICHRKHRAYCKNCKKIVEPKITDALPRSRLGLNILILSAWLHYCAGMSLGNLIRLFSFHGQLPLTASGLLQAWSRIAAILKPSYEQILQKLQTAKVLHADETGWRVNGVTNWLWCFASKCWCYYLIQRGRGQKVVKGVLGDLFHGVLICDFWGAYNAILAIAKQRCLYHLLTELLKVDKRSKTPQWTGFRKKLKRLLKDGIRLAAKRKLFSDTAFAGRKARLLDRLDELLECSYQDKDCRRLLKRLRRHRQEIFTFLDYQEVSPYNNHGEQQMRMAVLLRRISQGNRSARAAEVQAIFMSHFRSLELQGRDPIEEVLRLVRTALAGEAVALEVAETAAPAA